MKMIVVGCGQCGSRIADEFARLGKKARRERRMEIITGAFAVNTDAADLSGLSNIKSDYRHRILIGGRRTSGHGVGKINEAAAEIVNVIVDQFKLVFVEPIRMDVAHHNRIVVLKIEERLRHAVRIPHFHLVTGALKRAAKRA